MAQRRISDSHVGFLRRSSVYIAISALTSVFELGLGWISKRLPGEGFSTFWPLLQLFFIVTVPLAGVQLVVSKEVVEPQAKGVGQGLRVDSGLHLRQSNMKIS